MMKNNLSKTAAKGAVKILDAFLRMDANATSCVVMYQPKAPKTLAKYRRTK